eukprot:47397_1
MECQNPSDGNASLSLRLFVEKHQTETKRLNLLLTEMVGPLLSPARPKHRFNESIARWNALVTDSEQKSEKLRAIRKILGEQREQFQLKLTDLDRQVLEACSKLAEITAEGSEPKRDAAQFLITSLQEQMEVNNRQTISLHSLQSDISLLKGENERLKRELEESVEKSVRDQIESLRDALAQSRQHNGPERISGLRELTDSLQLEILKKDEKIGSLKETIRTLQNRSDADDQAGTIAFLSDSIQSKDSEIDDLKNTIERTSAQLRDLEKESQKLRQSLSKKTEVVSPKMNKQISSKNSVRHQNISDKKQRERSPA